MGIVAHIFIIDSRNTAQYVEEWRSGMTDLVSKSSVLDIYAELYDVFDDNKAIQKELDKVYDKLRRLKEQEETIELLEHDLSITQGMLNFYVNGND